MTKLIPILERWNLWPMTDAEFWTVCICASVILLVLGHKLWNRLKPKPRPIRGFFHAEGDVIRGYAFRHSKLHERDSRGI